MTRSINRRRLLQLAGVTGLGLTAAPAPHFRLFAAPAGYAGPLFLHVHATGAWDPTYFCEPLEGANYTGGMYTTAAKAGNINYAPLGINDDLALDPTDAARMPWDETERAAVMDNNTFFNKYYNDLLIINGVHALTNNHITGMRAAVSGRTEEGYPALGAVFAGHYAKERPLAFLSDSLYDHTAGILAATRINHVGAVPRFTRPNEVTPGDPSTALLQSPATLNLLNNAQRERLEALERKQQFPEALDIIKRLSVARRAAPELAALEVPEFAQFPSNLTSLNFFAQTSQVALSAFKAGLGACANLQTFGFDTHTFHRSHQRIALFQLWAGLDFLITRAKEAGLWNRMTIFVSSDFGRTAFNNGFVENNPHSNGKDHHPTTSVMIISGTGRVKGNRVFGKSGNNGSERYSLQFDPTTFKEDPKGEPVTITHIHRAVRQHLGLEGSEADRRFPVYGKNLPLFT